ncbi:hypothetical protein C922_02726 [Plasmodium inui San Antonio 1]|uniref:Uncharacterized protein n=1 Tax=Plasmodium inui San Antonio 1 TaxID=1237626 RepID=W7AN57_9APIC|nr:hypothetical protein C922_02726 [Plasmodium inui San Antonio 1]EUD66741.1 hypothetical protein C922_02726 [Plasmodium inui San Antonio 1]
MQLGCRGASAGARQALRTHRKKQQTGALNEYREKLLALSRHEKVVRIDLNGKEKKTSKYFFEKDKYVYVRTKAEIERFERGAGRPMGGGLVSSAKSTKSGVIAAITTANKGNAANVAAPARERKCRKSEKTLRDTYDLSQEELLYMKFIQKIKMKNIYSLLNNIRKNKYIISKKQRDTLLSCIYKYASHNCYVMSKTEFLFFLYLFPQQLKYASRAVHYLRSLLDKDQMTLTQCLRLINETNLFHVNCHVRSNYVRFLTRNAHKITLPQILNLLSKGSYLFAITPDFKTEEERLDDILKKKLLQIVMETKRIPLEGDLKWDYLHYMEWCARRENIYLDLLFNDLSVQLHRRIFIENVDVLRKKQEYQYIQRVLTLGSYNLCIDHLNGLAVSSHVDCFNTRGTITKVKVFPSYITGQGVGGAICDRVSGEASSEEATCDLQEVNQPNRDTHVKTALQCDDPAKKNQFSSKPTQESNTLRKMKMAFSFSTPFEKLQSSQYDQLKHMYQVNTKVTDKNVKVLLRFLRMVYHHNSSSHLENLLCRDNLPQIVSDLRRGRRNLPSSCERMSKIDYGEDSPLWRLTRWWASHQEISLPDKQVPSFYDLFEHTQGRTPSRGQLPLQEKPLLPCQIDQSEEVTILPGQETNEAKNWHSQEESLSNVSHLSDLNPAQNLPPLFEAMDTISRIVNNVYFSAQYRRKHFYKSQLNCLAKCLLYMSNSFVHYVDRGSNRSDGEVIPHRKEKLLLSQVEKTFYEIFTCVMKNVYLINLSNWFHIFVAVCKFGAAGGGAAGAGATQETSRAASSGATGEAATGGPHSKTVKPSEEDTFPTDRMENLLEIVNTVRAYRYQEVRTMVEEEDSRRCLPIGESPFPEGQLPGGDTPNYDTLHRIILSKFGIDDEGVITARRQARLAAQGPHNFGKTPDIAFPPAVKSTCQMATSPRVKTPQNSANFLLMMLSNYLDGAPFQMKRFLIILYHFNMSILKGAAVQAHLETKLQKNHAKFSSRYFYVHTGCGGNKPILDKSLVAKVRVAYLALKGGRSPGSASSLGSNLGSNIGSNIRGCPGSPGSRISPMERYPDDHTHDLYTQMENLLRRNRHCFTLDDMITFIVTYSLSGLYHSTVYFSISKWLLRYNLASLPDEVKIFLFILFTQCRHVYKPLQLYLLRLVFQIKQQIREHITDPLTDPLTEETAPPLLCALLHMLIRQGHRARRVRLKHVRYVERKFGRIHWPYFFPLELFLWKSAHKIASRRIRTLESDSMSDKSNSPRGKQTRTTATMSETTNSTELTLNLNFDVLKFEECLKGLLPQIGQHLEKSSIGGQDRRSGTPHGVMMSPASPPSAQLHPLDETTQQQMLQNCKNLLSYHFVQRNFLVSRRSLYYAILVQLKEVWKG